MLDKLNDTVTLGEHRKMRAAAEKEEGRHGKRSTYVNHKCRCQRCRQAQTDYMRGYMRGRRSAAKPEVTDE
jgi:hypothetical protein